MSVVNPNVSDDAFAACASPTLQNAVEHNSLHFSPKATAAFLAWWGLFSRSLSLPIRQGKLFSPDAPPPSKKFGRSLATIKVNRKRLVEQESDVLTDGSTE